MTDEALSETGHPQIPDDTSQQIVDTVLDLDEALSGDVRRAERVGRFCTKPWLQADLDVLEAELADLVDDQGRPLDSDPPMNGRDHVVVMAEYAAKAREISKAMRIVRLSAMEPSAWQAFKEKWKREIAAENLPPGMAKELVTACAIQPRIAPNKYDGLLERYGETAMTAVANQAWAACDHTGVDVPKSRVFSVVRRQQALSQS